MAETTDDLTALGRPLWWYYCSSAFRRGIDIVVQGGLLLYCSTQFFECMLYRSIGAFKKEMQGRDPVRTEELQHSVHVA